MYSGDAENRKMHPWGECESTTVSEVLVKSIAASVSRNLIP